MLLVGDPIVCGPPVTEPDGEPISIRIRETRCAERIWYRCGVDGDPAAPVVGLSERSVREYARWLTEITGHPYSVVMPLRGQAKRQDSGDCVERGQRRPDGGWDWLDDQTARDCPPSVARNGEKSQGFRVARRVSQDG